MTLSMTRSNAAQNKRIEKLENHLKQYENAHTPSNKKGGGDLLTTEVTVDG